MANRTVNIFYSVRHNGQNHRLKPVIGKNNRFKPEWAVLPAPRSFESVLESVP